MTSPGSWDLAEADPVAAVVWWLQNHTPLNELLREHSTGDGPVIGSRNEPPFPRLVVVDAMPGTLGTFNGRIRTGLSIEAMGDPDGTPGKGALWKIAVASAEALEQMTREPEVRGCVFSVVNADLPWWMPLPPVDQPRYRYTATLTSHPAWPSTS